MSRLTLRRSPGLERLESRELLSGPTADQQYMLALINQVRTNPAAVASHYTQDLILGIDSGYQNVGFSAITEKAEVVAGELHLLEGQVERNRERLVYRRQRRRRLRH